LNRSTGELLWHNSAAVRFVAYNPKFVYARDAEGRLLFLDRNRGTTLTNLDPGDFTFSLANGETDRLILGANDGLVISLHDRAYQQPLRLRNPPTVTAAPDEGKPETPAAPSRPLIKPRTPPPEAKPPADAPEKPPTTPPAKPPVTPPVPPPPPPED
jgi:hypothetical protein